MTVSLIKDFTNKRNYYSRYLSGKKNNNALRQQECYVKAVVAQYSNKELLSTELLTTFISFYQYTCLYSFIFAKSKNLIT